MIDAAMGSGDAAVDSPMTDTSTDTGPNCQRDEFDGSALQGHWSATQGGPPTHTVNLGTLTITDSPLANTPSNTNESWINDLEKDEGNQLGWAHAIGTGDFTLTTHVNWTGTTGDLHIGAVGVAGPTGQIIALAGAYDGGQNADGIAWAKLLGPTADASDDSGYSGAEEEPGSADFKIERIGGTVKFYVDNIEQHSGSSSEAVSHVIIAHVPYRLNANNYNYGTTELTFVEICRP
jgi:hypothetical protein